MKKVIISACVYILIMTGCTSPDKKTAQPALDTSQLSPGDTATKPAKDTENCTGRTMGKYKVYTMDEVALMVDQYRYLVWQYYLNATQKASFYPLLLQQIACDAKTMKFISIAEGTNVYMTMEYEKKAETSEHFYDVEDVFGKYTLCPPPSNCGISTDTSRIIGPTGEQIEIFCKEYERQGLPVIPKDEAEKMAQAYLEALKKDDSKVIQQVTLDPAILYAYLCGADAFSMIGAARDDGSITMLITYEKAGKIDYYDIRSVFGEAALCPPPDNCGIPFQNKKKMDSKRPVQKKKG